MARRRPRGANIRRNGGIAKRRQRSAVRGAAGESKSLIVSLKRGDRPSWAPWREGEISLWARRQATRESIGPHQRVTVRVSKPTEGRYPSVTSRVREIRKHGSVGARGEQSPWASRPFGFPRFGSLGLQIAAVGENINYKVEIDSR